MKEKSIWRDGFPKNSCPKLEKDLDVDVLIIGGGMTGISTAYHLRNSNLNVCLVEKNTIGCGVTSRTTGKLTYLQENIYSTLKIYVGKEQAKLYLESQMDAIKIVTNIIKKENIACNLDKVSSYIFSNINSKKMDKEKNLLMEFGINIKEAKKLPNGEDVEDAFYTEDTYVFHPLKYLYALKNICINKDISVYENTKIISMDKENEMINFSFFMGIILFSR